MLKKLGIVSGVQWIVSIILLPAAGARGGILAALALLLLLYAGNVAAGLVLTRSAKDAED